MSHSTPSRNLKDPPPKRTLNIYDLFDMVRKALEIPEVYQTFLRCVRLFNQDQISKPELLALVKPFLCRFPDLHKWFQYFLRSSKAPACVPLASAQQQNQYRRELAKKFYLSTCKKLDENYYTLRKTNDGAKCSGRTNLCTYVLNDTCMLPPSYAKHSIFVPPRKTKYENNIFQCEEGRFELDAVIESNNATLRVLENVQKNLLRMSWNEASRFRLDDCLGGTSPTIHQRSIRRLYGDKAAGIILGLKKIPYFAVPVVIRRLKSKKEEWRNAQKDFNKQWREQNEQNYLKSLDKQAVEFKQNDIKALRLKTLLDEIKTRSSSTVGEPHLVLPYKDKTILNDAANLLIHHVELQAEKTRIEHILRQFVPDLFFAPRQQLNDDERKQDDRDADVDQDREDGTSKPVLNNNNKNNGSNSSSSSTAPGRVNGGTTENVDFVSTIVKKEILDCDTATSSAPDSGMAGSSTSVAAAVGVTPTNMICGVSSSVSATRDSTVENSKDILPDVAIKVEIKQENDPDQPEGSQDIQSQQQTNSSLQPHDISEHIEEAYKLFFTNDNWYLFLRFHAILCERLRTIHERAKIMITEEEVYRSTRSNSIAMAHRLKPGNEINVEDYYSTFVDMLKRVLDGNMKASDYEDSLRKMFGIYAYIAFTLNTVVENAVRQLEQCVMNRDTLKFDKLFLLEQRKGGAGGLCHTASRRVTNELNYQRKAKAALQGKNCFKIYVYRIDCRVTIELLGSEPEEEAPPQTPFLSRNKRRCIAANPLLATELSSVPVATEEGSIYDLPLDTNTASSNVSKNERNASPAWQSRSDGNQNYHVLILKNYSFYKLRSLKRAKQTHQAVTRSKRRRFDRFIEGWLERNVSDDQRSQCNEWLTGSRQPIRHHFQ